LLPLGGAGRLPTTAELDALGTRGPILLRRGSHLAVLNSRATELVAGHQPATGAGPVTSDSVITRALGLAGMPTAAQRREDLATVMARLAARGITSIREAGVDAAELELFGSLRHQGLLSLRCDLLWRVPEGSDTEAALGQIADLPSDATTADDPFLRLTGVKAFVDGRIADAAIGAQAAPGTLRMNPAQLRDIVGASLRRCAGVGCHAVGDAAVRLVLDAYERALSAGLAPDPGRLVVEHALDCAPETIERLAACGVAVSAHPSIVYEFSGEIRRHWGAGRAARAAPVRDMIAAGVRVAAGSDGDVPPFDPLRGIWFMATREGRSGGTIGQDQALDRATAFDLYTRCGAALLGVQARRGELRPGLDADLAVFSADPLACPVGQLPDIEVLLTLVGGQPVHDPAGLMRQARPR
jgi:predicted amidohydrolase YtcJ